MPHEDQGYDRDLKYSRWRRNGLSRGCYTTDLDWLEWRHGRPVALIETRRNIGTLTTAPKILEHFKTLNNGFQPDVYSTLAKKLGIPAYLVAIIDLAPEQEGYADTTFVVHQIFSMTELRPVGVFNQAQYTKFIEELK